MGYSLQYCLNECGNAVPGNECDWEDGVCDACRERREDEAEGEAMTDWTKEDTEELRNVAQNVTYRGFKAELEIEHRAAAHIESLEARVAELEAREDERAALLSQAISHAREMEARHEKTTSHTFELYAMLSQRNARIAALEAERAEVARELRDLEKDMWRVFSERGEHEKGEGE